jgi:regulator of protease activity HflC (stomatin/prohibitin superfamily)
MTGDQHTYQRAVSASSLGLLVQSAVAVALLLLWGLWSKNPAIAAAAWHAFGGLPLWVTLWIVYQQHRLERIEALEAEQLAAQNAADRSIFETTQDDLSVARRRLNWLHKWMVPIVSFILAAYLVGMGSWLFQTGLAAVTARTQVMPEDPLLGLVFSVAIALGCFLISRYVAGMAKVPAWSLLRGGAGYLMGSFLIGIALAAGLFLHWLGFNWLLAYLSVAVPVFMVLIGVEVLLNLVLGFYRPRRVGEIPRAAFDSRVLSLLTSPESIAKTINEAINYQFGFEITRSWFWQLLSRAFVGLVVFGAVVMLGLSCIVIVEPQQQAIITRFGRLVGQPLDPGLHFKAPWPISRAEYFDVRLVRELLIGSSEDVKTDGPILWSNEHSKSKAEPLIVAPTALQGVTLSKSDKAPAISLVNAEIMVQYRVAPGKLLEYVMADASDDPRDPDPRLRDVATRAVAAYLLRHDIDQWIGSARVTASAELKQVVQKEADANRLGVEIIGVSVASIHPPQEVARDFHNVIRAEQEKQTTIERAQQEAVDKLASVAGSPQIAEELVREIRAAEESATADPKRLARIEQLLQEAGGEAASIIAQARAERWQKENVSRGEAQRFSSLVNAYRQAPRLFQARNYLEVITDGLAKARKILVASRRKDLTVRADMKDVEGAIGTLPEPPTGGK